MFYNSRIEMNEKKNLTTEETFALAVQNQQKNNLQVAENLYKETLGINIGTPFLVLTYNDAMNRFGSDKPDLRFGLELVDLSELLAGTEFKVFTEALNAGGVVKAINVKNSAEQLSRKALDDLTELAKVYGAKGMAWIKINSDGFKSSTS